MAAFVVPGKGKEMNPKQRSTSIHFSNGIPEKKNFSNELNLSKNNNNSMELSKK